MYRYRDTAESEAIFLSISPNLENTENFHLQSQHLHNTICISKSSLQLQENKNKTGDSRVT
jgi:hypothetical protein